MIASLAVGGLLLTGMVIATWYAAIRLPGDARVPLHAGSPEYSLWLSKRTGLAAWLAAGAVVFAALAWLTLSRAAANWAASMRVTLLPAVMCVALAAEVAAIILARRAVPAKTASADPSFYQLRGDTSGKSDAKEVITDRKMRGPGHRLRARHGGANAQQRSERREQDPHLQTSALAQPARPACHLRITFRPRTRTKRTLKGPKPIRR